MIAFLSVGVPPAAVYLAKPFCIAAIAASLMCCGVSKSGSPAPIEITSLPSDFRRAALAETARVGEGLMAFKRLAARDMESPGTGSDARKPYFTCLRRSYPGSEWPRLDGLGPARILRGHAYGCQAMSRLHFDRLNRACIAATTAILALLPMAAAAQVATTLTLEAPRVILHS